MAFRYILIYTAVFAFLQLKIATGQQPAPQTNPCNQTVIVPISGGHSAKSEEDTNDAKAYGVGLGFNGTYVIMNVSKAPDRDGPSYHKVDDIDVFSFDVICTYTSGINSQTTKYIRVTAMVKDINDNAPEFVSSTPVTDIQETLPLQSRVIQVSAVDKDTGLNGEIQYSIVRGDKFVLRVLSMMPVVPGPESNSENITAFDLDDIDAAITFELLGSIPSGFANRFVVSSSGPIINKTVGTHKIYMATLMQKRPVERKEIKFFSLFLKAKQTDDENKYCIAQIMITVNPSSSYRPVVMTNTDDNVGYIAEDSTPGTNVRASASGKLEPLEIRVTDGDLAAGDTQRYTYKIDSTGSKFSIHAYGDRAIILVTEPLDYSDISRYDLKVQVIEWTLLPHPAFINIVVIIQPKNDSKNDTPRNCICFDGWYGKYCNRTCPANCARCTSYTHCLECARGFFGTNCSLSCPTNCLFCNTTDGSCIGFLNCDKINNEIDEIGETCSVSTLIFVAVGSLSGTLIIVTLIVILRQRSVTSCLKRNQDAARDCHRVNESNTHKTNQSDNVSHIKYSVEFSNVNSGDSQMQTGDHDQDIHLEHYKGLKGPNEEYRAYDVLKTPEYEELGERAKEEQQYEGLKISKL